MPHRFSNSIFASSLLLMSLVLIGFGQAQGVSIPVTSGNTPTCLGQMYTDVLFPSGYVPYYDYDVNAPTAFANTSAGTLGLDIFFEVRPYGYEMVYDSSGEGGSNATASIAAAAINRSNSNNVDTSNYPGNPG